MDNIRFLENFTSLINGCSESDRHRICSSANQNQRRSKTWLFDRLVKHTERVQYDTITVIGGWYGLLMLPLISERLITKSVVFIDKDEHAINIAEKIFSGCLPFTCTFLCEDVFLNPARFSNKSSDLIINTSCEHMIDMSYLTIPQKTVVAVQSANTDAQRDPDHTNPCSSEAELVTKTGLNEVFYSGAKMLQPDKTRFLAIGTR